MGRCRLCGRTIQNNEKNYGDGCILKCYNLLKLDYKKIEDKETNLNDIISLINGKIGLSTNIKSELTDRYLSLKLLKNIKIDIYKIYSEEIRKNIRSIEKYSIIPSTSIKLSQAYEAYKFYNKFYKVLRNKSREIKLNDKTQNIVWNALNFGLSRYYNRKKYLSGITQQLQYVFWKSGVALLKLGGYKVSAELLNHAITDKPDNLIIRDGFIVEEIKKNAVLKNRIKALINNANEDSIMTEDVIEFKDGDLAASLHKMSFKVIGEKRNNKWVLHVKLEDTYDFTDLKELQEYIDNKLSGFILATANNAAMLSTSCGVLNVYNITIEFDYKEGG